MIAEDKRAYLEDIANRIRVSALEMTTKAGSGHPTTGMSEAEILSVLYFHHMLYDPVNPNSLQGDDFVLSKGHGAPGLYAAMDLAGMLQGENVMGLREFDSALEGHPVPRLPGVRVGTGSLGQGLSAGLGLATAMKLDGIDRHAYVLLGDGEMAEGNVWEAINIAPHLGLDNIIGIIDVNRLGQSQATMYGWDTDAYRSKIEAFGWYPQVVDGHSVEELSTAFQQAVHSDRPSMIIAKTVKGKGADFLENADGRHGKAVSEEELEEAKKQLRALIKDAPGEPENQRSLEPMPRTHAPQITITPEYTKGEEEATRTAYGKALAKLGEGDESLVVLDGDVKGSSRTKFFFKEFPERSIEGYIAEQNMIGMALGLQARGKRPHTATFAAFLTRAHDQIRMASYSDANLTIAGSHTGVSIGEDGPSQMGLEDNAMMRALFNSAVVSPADAVSAEKLLPKLHRREGISYMRTIRGKTPVLYENGEEFDLGGSKLHGSTTGISGAIVAAGITVTAALEAQKSLAAEGIEVAVIDAYSIKPIDAKRIRTIAENARFLLAVEDHYPEGGLGEAVAAAAEGAAAVYIQGVTKKPHSGPPGALLEEQGLDAGSIAERVKELSTEV
ncbi:MAG: transketolase [Spirochaetaceae bacterium]